MRVRANGHPLSGRRNARDALELRHPLELLLGRKIVADVVPANIRRLSAGFGFFYQKGDCDRGS